jgi:hypothetical protein
LPVITTSAEEDDSRECSAEAIRTERNRDDNATNSDASATSVATTTVQDCASRTDFPNFASALQLTDDALANRPGISSRPIYPNIPYSPYSSPRTIRRKSPLKESRRVSIDKCGIYQQLNQYKLIDSIGQVRSSNLFRFTLIAM